MATPAANVVDGDTHTGLEVVELVRNAEFPLDREARTRQVGLRRLLEAQVGIRRAAAALVGRVACAAERLELDADAGDRTRRGRAASALTR